MKMAAVKTTMLGAALAALFTGGCVEEEPSLLLVGSLVLEGSIDESGESETPVRTLQCKLPADVDSAKLSFPVGRMNIKRLETFGQDHPRANLSSATAPAPYDVVSGALSGPPSSFHFVAGFSNRMPDSRSVGAKSGGGGSGGFQNMFNDNNTVQISGATVRFPAELNTFVDVDGFDASFEFEATRLFNAILPSSGGNAIIGVPVVQNNEELSLIKEFITDTLGSNKDSIVTFVVEITVEGKSIGGTEVKSNILRYPIEVCVDCNSQGITPTCAVQK